MENPTRNIEHRRRPGPDFLCIGAQKGGTQWLYDQLQYHPDFWMPPIKELHYFDFPSMRAQQAKVLYNRAAADLSEINEERDADSNRPLEARDLEFLKAFVQLTAGRKSRVSVPLWKASSLISRFVPGYSRFHHDVVRPTLMVRGQPDFLGYARLFEWKGRAVSGDITPAYSSILTSDIVQGIMKAFPRLKVVYIARDPVERFWSAINMRAGKGHGWPEDRAALHRLLKEPGYTDRSHQTQIVARWRRFVPAEDFGLFLFDDLVADAATFRRSMLTFLGGDPDKPSGALPPDFNRKGSSSKRPLSDEFRQLLSQLLTDELRKSAEEFGGSATNWPKKYGL